MKQLLLLSATGILTLSLTACASSDHTAAKKPARKIYYAHNVQTGSHLQRAYNDPNEDTSSSIVLSGSPDAGQRPFVNSDARGNSHGMR